MMTYLGLVNFFIAGACANSALGELLRSNSSDVMVFVAIGIANLVCGGLLINVSAGTTPP